MWTIQVYLLLPPPRLLLLRLFRVAGEDRAALAEPVRARPELGRGRAQLRDVVEGVRQRLAGPSDGAEPRARRRRRLLVEALARGAQRGRDVGDGARGARGAGGLEAAQRLRALRAPEVDAGLVDGVGGQLEAALVPELGARVGDRAARVLDGNAGHAARLPDRQVRREEVHALRVGEQRVARELDRRAAVHELVLRVAERAAATHGRPQEVLLSREGCRGREDEVPPHAHRGLEAACSTGCVPLASDARMRLTACLLPATPLLDLIDGRQAPSLAYASSTSARVRVLHGARPLVAPAPPGPIRRARTE